MGEVTILVLVCMLGATIYLCERLRKRIQLGDEALRGLRRHNDLLESRVATLTFERDELLRHKSLTQTQPKAQDVRKPLNSAAARQRVEQMNRGFYSADKQVSNSEILKEHSNG
jgi:hypothetical protein